LGQGRENAKEFLREHPEIAQEIEQKIREVTSIKQGIFRTGSAFSDEDVTPQD
jgi:recombination protein RecA